MSSSSRRSSTSHGTRESSYHNDSSNEPTLERRGTGGQMLFTGPDYIRDHRVTVDPEHHSVGIGTMSPEGTSEVDYLWRAPIRQSFPRPKSTCVGEIGWGVPRLNDWSLPQSGAQIMLGEFRQAVEDKHTHLYQNAWYPGINETSSFHHNNNNLVTIDRGDSGSARQRPGRGGTRETPMSADRRNSSASASTYNSNNSAHGRRY